MSLQKVNQTTGATTPIAGVPAKKINGIQDTINKNGAKNLYDNTMVSNTVYGVTFTKNTDGSVTVNGTATETIDFQMNLNVSLRKGEYILSGSPSGGGYATNYCLWLHNANHDVVEGGEGQSFSIASDESGIVMSIVVYQGTTLTNATFYPMIRLATDTDDTYVPYAMTNKELTEMMIPSSTDSFIAPMILGQQYTMASMPYSCTHVKMQTLGVLGNSAVSVDMTLNVYNKTFVYIPTDTLVSTLAADSHYTGLTKEMLINTGGLHAYFVRVD